MSAPAAQPLEIGATPTTSAVPRQSAIYRGRIRHRRSRPHANQFDYGLFMLYLDLDELDELFKDRWLWSINRPNLASFRRGDFHGDRKQPLDQAVRTTVRQQCGLQVNGPIRLLCHLRYFGHSFNPVSFYYCFDPGGTQLQAIVAEITNTPWGERHCYVLPTEAGQRHGRAWHFAFDKRFHVSPFLPMQMRYDWRFDAPGTDLHVHMNALDEQGKIFDATLSMQREEITGLSLARQLIRFPAMTSVVLARIYWQALLIRCKRNPFYAHP